MIFTFGLQEGERKLYLAIEGTSEPAVQQATLAISRILKEEITASVSESLF